MQNKTINRAILIAGLALGATSAVHSADEPKLIMGASDFMLAGTCVACHGNEGASVGPASPSIGGLSKDYFLETMQGFASGDIPSTIMGRIAKGYTDGEIEQMANYFIDKPFVKAKQEFDATKVKKGAKLHDKYCEKCHAEGGSSKEDDSGILAGQWIHYTRWQMADYIAGHRPATKKMKKKVKKLVSKEGDAGVEALIHYYASQK